MGRLVLNPWIDANPVQRQFILSKDFEVCLMSPRGEGKTEAGIRRMCMMAASQPREVRPIPWAIIRDTWKNLERTTLKSILHPHPGSFAEKIRPLIRFSSGGEKVWLPGLWEAELFGVDSLGDLNRFQSMQLGGLWIEEPAPAVEEIGGGLEERVVTLGITSLRYPCEWRTIQITSNYPDENHWAWQRYGVRRIGRLFRIPRGENPHLPANYREEMEKSLAGDPGLLNRLVYGEPGFVLQGEAVTPEYQPSLHRAAVDLQPYPNLVGYRLWDGWFHPTCVVCQLTPRGQLHVYEVISGRGMGMQQLVTEFVKPIMKERYWMIPEWEDIGDPSIADADQSNYEQSAAMVIERELHTHFRPGPRSWAVRKEALKAALLKRTPDGQHPFLLLSASPLVQPLHQALRGGWHYRKLPSGQVVGKVPVKDLHSHPGDALSYGLPELLTLAGEGLIDPWPSRPSASPSYSWEWERDFWQEVGRCEITGY